MNGTTAYVLSKKFTSDSLIGLGAIKGASCEVEAIDKINGTTSVTLKWKDSTGAEHTRSFDINDGISVVNSYIDESNSHLIFELSDDNIIDCGKISANSYTKDEIGDITKLPIVYKDVIGNINDIYDTLNNGGFGSIGTKTFLGTLVANNWENNTQTVSIENFKGTENGIIGLSNIATSEEIEAARNAIITVTGVEGNKITFKCEKKPIININFIIIVFDEENYNEMETEPIDFSNF